MGKYATFKGRASRSEYWWFVLFIGLLYWGDAIVMHLTALKSMALFLQFAFQLAFFLPSLAAMVRRLHDTNRSGWWFLINFTIIGIVPFYIWLAKKGNEQENKYGPPV